MNFIEQLPLIFTLILITAMKEPLAALVISIVYFCARVVYTIGYLAKGPNYRAAGALTILALLIIGFGYGFYSSAELMKFYNLDLNSSGNNDTTS